MARENIESPRASVEDPLIPERTERKAWSQEVVTHRRKTSIKMDLLSRTLSATMELAKWSFEYARMQKGRSWYTWYERIPLHLSNQLPPCLRPDAPDLNDFMRAYNLVHDWYPKLHEDVRIHRETWSDCNRHVLESMQKLLQDGVIHGNKDVFCDWAEKKLAENREQARKTRDKAEVVLRDMKDLLDKNVIRSKEEQESQEMIRKLLDNIVVEPIRTTLTGPNKADDAGERAGQWCCREDARIDDVRQNLQAMYALACGAEGGGNRSEGYWLLALKTPFLRVMWIILMLDFCLMYEAGALGLLTQLFLELNVVIDRSQDLRLWRLIFLPLAVILFSIFGTVLSNLVHGAFQYPPFQFSRARLIIFATPGILCGDSLVKGKLQLIDFFYTDALLISTVLGGLLFAFLSPLQGDDPLFDCILNGLNAGALFWTCCCVLLNGVARFYCNLWLETNIERVHKGHTDIFPFLPECVRRNLPQCALADEEKIKTIVFRPTRCGSILMDAFQTYGIIPGETWTYFLCLQRFLQIHWHDDHAWNADQVAKWVKKEGEDTSSWEAYSKKLATLDNLLLVSKNVWGRTSGIMIMSFVAWILTMIVCIGLNSVTNSEHKGWVLIAANVGITCTVLFSIKACERAMPLLTAGRTFRIHGIIFIVLIYAFSFLTAKIAGGPGTLTPLMTKSSAGQNSNETRGIFYNDGRNKGLATPYPVCTMSWGEKQAKVGILDLAAMAYYAYVETKPEFEALLNSSFDDAEMITWSNFSEIPRVVAARICHNAATPCTVILAVKGTSNKLEIMTDVGIFSTVSVLQMLDLVAPLLGTVPISVLAFIIEKMRLPFMKKAQENWIDKLEAAVKDLQSNYSDDSLVITGHSLGGNFAELIGAKLDIPSIGFSAPGQFYMMDTFGLGREEIAENVLTVIPSMDVIPHVAKHVDIIQKILCRRANGNFREPAECHSMEATGCELWRVCGDKQKRNFSQKCLDKPDPSNHPIIPEPLVNEKCIGQIFHHKTTAPCHLVAASQ